MQLHILDPTLDSRWDDLVGSHSRASVFHQSGWLKALAMTYGYHPLVLTSTPEGSPLSDGVVFAEVNSWITGSRLVSLPFADHCEPLLNETSDFFDLSAWIGAECQIHDWKYVELRPLSWESGSGDLLRAEPVFLAPHLDLTQSIGQIFDRFHKTCMQRRIRRAERAQLSYEKGCSEEILGDFYRLLMITRRRHQLLPQPLAWFQNLIAYLSPNLDIRVVRKNGAPIAAILALRHGLNVVYKYGCSDEASHHLAAMPFLFWKLIEESKAEGAEQIDFGRTDLDNEGLIAFKDRFGTTKRRLTYLRYPNSEAQKSALVSQLPAARRLFSILPDALSSRVGGLLYRHIG